MGVSHGAPCPSAPSGSPPRATHAVIATRPPQPHYRRPLRSRDLRPSRSPDGRRIAFDSDRDGYFEIYGMNADGTGLVRLTNNTVDDVNRNTPSVFNTVSLIRPVRGGIAGSTKPPAELISTAVRTLSRRTFLSAGAAAGGGLLVSFSLPAPLGRALVAGAQTARDFMPNGFIRIARDGGVTLIMHKVEMGQGTYTAMPMLLAEERDVELSQVHLEHAPPDDARYAEPLFGVQETGGSTSVRGNWEPLRRAGATARALLVTAAAQTWKVDPSSCHAAQGQVIHGPTGRSLGYGALVAQAAALPVPGHVTLKDPKDFQLIGTPAKRLDAPEKVNGTAQFGIDVTVPGMKVATLAACPVFGGKLASVDDAKAKGIKGVQQVVRLDDAVAVVADHMWAAKQGLAALDIRWDEGPNAKLSTADIVQQLAAASEKPGVVARNEGDAPKAMAGDARHSSGGV